jgi:predicted GIY-YIG superfamily endonuclease
MHVDGFYLYILKCADDSYYIGHTDNLEKRVAEHNDKKYYGYTCTRLPITLAYSEHFQTREEAFIAERKIKKWTRKKKEVLITYGWKGFANKAII